MRITTAVDHETTVSGAVENEQSGMLEAQRVSAYASPQVPENGRAIEVVFPYSKAVAIEAGTMAWSREVAHYRYQLLIKPLLSRTISPTFGLAAAEQVPKYRKKLKVFWQKMWGECLISPFFLLSSLAIILVVPEKLVKKIAMPFTKANFWDQFGKRVFDFVGAIAGFIFSAIFFIIVPILIKLDSKGPIFYGQQRAGMNHRRRDRRQVNIVVAHDRRVGERRKQDLLGRPFTVYKFRTMRVDAEKQTGAVWAQKNDPRVTPVGRILRFIHIDEIPQFFNVLCGEMSMVGPRPERPQIMTKLLKEIPQFPERLQVKPGITGIAQIYCGYDATIDDAREKLRYDLMYVKNTSLKHDIAIMLKTLWMILNGREVVKKS
ncbi:MAG: sugar transferase [candidate division KSB1 bacterium]|nr:sugar transferase [candidate division KSB1 bacterium]MDZ7302303.1 sugar transferase [candidate division KSB1 bacterium]MDZ7311409.1 sugar transferase [candidate division KSB1 bacterium]